MEISKFIYTFKRWFLLVVLIAILGAGISVLSTIRATPTYLAETKVLIGGFITSPNPSRGEIETGASLSETYVVLVTTTPVLQGVIDTLDLPLEASDLKKMVLAAKPGNPPIILIQVYYNDPNLAVQIATEVANQLILKSPSNLTPAQEAQIDLANQQIDILNGQIQTTLDEINIIDERLGDNTTAQTETGPLTQQRNALTEQVNQASANMAQYSATIANLEQQTNTLQVIEPASEALPYRVGPGLIEGAILSALVGLVLGLIAIAGIAYLDSTMRTSKEVTSGLEMPVIGTIPRFGRGQSKNYQKQLISNQPARSPISEAYRALQANLFYGTKSRNNTVYIVTSPGEFEGKTITCANLAITMALSRVRVALIDANMLEPKLHKVFGLENQVGLSTWLATSPIPSVASDHGSTSPDLNGESASKTLKACLQETGIENLTVITSGPTVENSAQLLSSSSIQSWVELLQSEFGFDVILFDTPACLEVADTSILAAKLTADCLLVLKAGDTHRDAAQRVKQQFEQIGSEIKGIILTYVKLQNVDHGYTSGYVHINPINLPTNHVPRSTNSHTLVEESGLY